MPTERFFNHKQGGNQPTDYLLPTTYIPTYPSPFIYISYTKLELSSTFHSISTIIYSTILSPQHHIMDPPPYVSRESFSSRDFESASIRSAAPSYVSEAPTYVSTLPSSDSSSSSSSGLPSYQSPPSPSIPRHPRANSIPSLDAFRMPTWSRTTANPTARHYHSVRQFPGPQISCPRHSYKIAYDTPFTRPIKLTLPSHRLHIDAPQLLRSKNKGMC